MFTKLFNHSFSVKCIYIYITIIPRFPDGLLLKTEIFYVRITYMLLKHLARPIPFCTSSCFSPSLLPVHLHQLRLSFIKPTDGITCLKSQAFGMFTLDVSH